MSASCAPAARPPARLIGGTATAISVLPSSCRLIAGSRTAATSAPASGSTSSKIPSGSIAATPSSTAPRPARRGSTRRRQSPRSSGNWWSAASNPRRLSRSAQRPSKSEPAPIVCSRLVDQRRRFVTLRLGLGLDGLRRRVQLSELRFQPLAELPQRSAELDVGGLPHLPTNLLHQLGLALLGSGRLPRIEIL